MIRAHPAAEAGYRVFEFLEAEEMEDESKKVGYLKEVTGKVSLTTSHSPMKEVIDQSLKISR